MAELTDSEIRKTVRERYAARQPRHELPIASCALDAAGRGAQADSYRRLAAAVEEAERAPGPLTVRIGEQLDRGLLEQTVTVERSCCPFLSIAWDAGKRTLTVAVEDASMAPALDALAEALGV
jgi:hypothetical protein